MKSNSVLENLVEYILLELLEAQNVANKESAKLADNYLNKEDREDGVPNLEYFPIPNPAIKSFDFALKFGLKDIGILLSGDALDQLNEKLRPHWKHFLSLLLSENLISEKKEIKLLDKFPEIKQETFQQGLEKLPKKNISLVEFIKRRIIIKFVSSLKKIKQPKKITRIASELEIEEDIQETLIHLDNYTNKNVSNLKAVFDINRLSNVDKDIICDININVEMRSFDAAFYLDEKGDKSKDKKFLMCKG